MKRRVLLWSIVACAIGVAVLVWTSATTSREPTTGAMRAREVRAPSVLGHASRSTALDAVSPGLRLEGLVVDRGGEPVRGARVWVAEQPSRSVVTGDDGAFALEGLAHGSYRVIARHGDSIGGPRPIRLGERTEPVVIRLAPGVAVEVTVVDEARRPIADAEVRVLGDPIIARTDTAGTAGLRGLSPGWIDLEARAPGFAPGRLSTAVELVGAPARVTITLSAGVPVAGRVRDERGATIAGVRVYAVRGSAFVEDHAAAAAITDADGAFVIPAVAPGAYWFAFFDDAHLPSRIATTLIDRAVTGLDVVMQAGALVAGTVVDRDGRPVPHATVRLAAARNDMGLLRPRQTISGADGTYELRGLARAQYTLRAESEAGVSPAREIDLAAQGPALRDQDLVLEPAHSISGVVVDERGDPVPGVPVQATEVATVHVVAAKHEVTSSAITDDGGAFSIEGLSNGAYELAAGHGETLRRSMYANAGDRDVRIVYPRAGAITGTLVLADSGTAPRSFLIRLEPKSTEAVQAPGGDDGRFELREIPPGTYVLAFWGPELVETRTPSFEVRPGETTDLGTVRVGRGRTLTGKVVDGQGRPVAGAKVSVGVAPLADRFPYDDRLDGLRSTITDARGAFSIVGLQDVTFQVSIGAEHPVHGRSRPVDVPGGAADPPPVTLVLRAVGSIAGRVLQGGGPLPHTLIGVGDPEHFGMSADEDGAFLIPSMPEGPLTLRVHLLEGEPASYGHTVQVVAGSQTRVTIDVPVASVAVTVEARPHAGTSIEFAEISLFHGDVRFSNRRELLSRLLSAGGSGKHTWRGSATAPVRFDRLVPGDHTVCVVLLDGDSGDPDYKKRLFAQSESLQVHCAPISVLPAPAEQSVSIEIPTMKVGASR